MFGGENCTCQGRALILRFMSIPPMVADLLSDTIYPAICVSAGWQAMPYIHGVGTGLFLILWHLFVSDKPPKEIAPAAANGAVGQTLGDLEDLQRKLFSGAVVVFTQEDPGGPASIEAPPTVLWLDSHGCL